MTTKLFTPAPEHIKQCPKCSATITYAYSFKSGRPYPVDIRNDGQADRTAFHSKTCATTAMKQAAAPAPVQAPATPAPDLTGAPGLVIPAPAALYAMRRIIDNPAPAYSADILTDLLGDDSGAHQALEDYIRANQAGLVAALNKRLASTQTLGPSGGLAVLDKPAPAPVVQPPASPVKPVVQPPAAPKPADQVSSAPAAPGVKLGEYLCNNSDCKEVSFTLEVKPGKPNCCPSCKRILLFKGLSVS